MPQHAAAGLQCNTMKYLGSFRASSTFWCALCLIVAAHYETACVLPKCPRFHQMMPCSSIFTPARKAYPVARPSLSWNVPITDALEWKNKWRLQPTFENDIENYRLQEGLTTPTSYYYTPFVGLVVVEVTSVVEVSSVLRWTTPVQRIPQLAILWTTTGELHI